MNLSLYLVDSDISQSHPPEILHLFVGHRGNGVNSSSTIGCNLHTSIAYVQVIPHLVAAIVTMMDLFVTVIVIIFTNMVASCCRSGPHLLTRHVVKKKRNNAKQSKAKPRNKMPPKITQKLPANFHSSKGQITISPLGDQPLFGFKVVISNIQNSPEPTDFFIY